MRLVDRLITDVRGKPMFEHFLLMSLVAVLVLISAVAFSVQLTRSIGSSAAIISANGNLDVACHASGGSPSVCRNQRAATE